MRRIVLVTLLALALPMAASATSFTFTATSPPTTGLLSSISFTPTSLTFRFPGANGIAISLSGAHLGPCPAVGLCRFTGGTLAVTGPGHPLTNPLLADIVTGGFVTGRGLGVASISAVLSPNPIVNGVQETNVLGLMHMSLLGWTPANGPIGGGNTGSGFFRSGSGTVTGRVVPEPGTLGMLGTGLIGLAGMVRRKFKLWT